MLKRLGFLLDLLTTGVDYSNGVVISALFSLFLGGAIIIIQGINHSHPPNITPKKSAAAPKSAAALRQKFIDRRRRSMISQNPFPPASSTAALSNRIFPTRTEPPSKAPPAVLTPLSYANLLSSALRPPPEDPPAAEKPGLKQRSRRSDELIRPKEDAKPDNHAKPIPVEVSNGKRRSGPKDTRDFAATSTSSKTTDSSPALPNGHPSMRSLTLTQSTLLLPRLLLLLLLLLLPAVNCQFAPHPLPVPPTLPHHPLIPRIFFRLLAWLRPLMFLRRPPQMQPCL